MLHFLSILYLAAIILQPAEWIKIFDGVAVQETIIMVGLLVAAAFRTQRLQDVLLSKPSKIFLLFIFISILSSVGEGKSYALGIIGVIYIKFYLGFILLIVATETDEQFNKTLKYLVFCAVIVSYHCINLYHNGVEIGHGIGETAHILNWRGSVQWLGTYAGTNTTALMLLLPLSASFGLLYKQDKFFNKLYFLFTTAAIGYAFYLTHSRGGTIGLLLIFGYYFYIKTHIKLKYYLPIAVVCIVVLLALKPQEEGRGLGESSTPERVELLHQGIQLFKNNPVLGVGSGQFAERNPIHKTAHNIYLNTLAETGFIGLFLFILLYYLPTREILKLKSKIGSAASDILVERQIHIAMMALLSFSAATFFLTARHEIPFIVLTFLTLVGFNKNMDFSFSFREIKLILSIITILIAFVYGAIQLFFAIYR